jgi:hypothetical protein
MASMLRYSLQWVCSSSDSQEHTGYLLELRVAKHLEVEAKDSKNVYVGLREMVEFDQKYFCLTPLSQSSIWT